MPLLSIPVRVLGETEEEPVGGASVRFFRAQAGNYEYVADLTTGVDGVALARVPAGEYWVLVRAPGRARLAQPVVLQGERDLRLTVAAATTPLVIRVRDGEEPVEGAAVLVTAGDQLPVAGTTDGEGRVALEGLRGGSRTLLVYTWGVLCLQPDRFGLYGNFTCLYRANQYPADNNSRITRPADIKFS